MKKGDLLKSLVTIAEQAGASKALVIPAQEVLVEKKLANFCFEPKCPFWGQSLSCPPLVGGPEDFKKKLLACEHALLIRFEVDAPSLQGDDRAEVLRVLQEMVATVEIKAKELGFDQAAGFAGGSCKASFCADYNGCRAMEGGICRFPDQARPSLSGYGVNVGKLMESAGWSSKLFFHQNSQQLAWVAGLVLLA